MNNHAVKQEIAADPSTDTTTHSGKPATIRASSAGQYQGIEMPNKTKYTAHIFQER